jgi:hypothetical protein
LRKIVLRVAACIAALIAALAAWLAWQWLPPRPKLVVSRETTWIVEPLLPDGTVDYEGAWRSERSAGVTPENNAAPFLFATLGVDLAQFSEAERAALPKKVGRFVDFGTWKYDHQKSLPEELLEEHVDAGQAIEALENGEAESPAARLAVLWLDAIAECLPEIERVVKRDHLFAPGSYRDGGAAWEMFDIFGALRGSAAVASASGKANAAFAHLAPGLRLARLQRALEQGAQYIAAECGEASTWESALRIARRDGHVSSADVRELLAAADPSDADARLRASVAAVRVHGLDFFSHPNPIANAKSSMLDGWIARIDPNRACRRFNESMDRIAAAFCTGSWSDRLDRVGQLQQRLSKANAELKSGKALWALHSRDAFCDAVVDSLVAVISRTVFEVSVPSILQSERALIELVALAFATEKGRDPKNSDDLTPLVFPKPWRDRVTGSAVDFERQADGTLVARGPLIDLQSRFEEWSKKPVSKRGH